MTAADPATVAAVLEALAAKGYTVTPPAEPDLNPAPAEPALPAFQTPDVSCHRCGTEVPRKTARAEGWRRAPEGWICNAHSPIDFMHAGDLASGLIDYSELTFKALMKLSAGAPEALEHIDEMRYLLADLEAVVRPLRPAKPTP